LELSHEKFKKANSREKIERVLGSLYVRFGKVISTQTEKSEVENRNFATIVRIVQKTEFQNGTAIEIFGFQLEDGRAALRQYEIETTGLEGFEPER
jgi:hypothetical protein